MPEMYKDNNYPSFKEFWLGSRDKVQNVQNYDTGAYQNWINNLGQSSPFDFQGMMKKLLGPYYGQVMGDVDQQSFNTSMSGMMSRIGGQLLSNQHRVEINQGKPGILPIVGSAIGSIWGPMGSSIGKQIGTDINANATHRYESMGGNAYNLGNPSYDMWGQRIGEAADAIGNWSK